MTLEIKIALITHLLPHICHHYLIAFEILKTNHARANLSLAPSRG